MIKNINTIICSIIIIGASSAWATPSYNCPTPEEIQSTDFTSPSIWLGPPVLHSMPNQVGVGLGGKAAKQFLGAQKAQVNHKPGWVCVYRSEGGTTVSDYQITIRNIVAKNKFLYKYLAKLDKAYKEAAPYLQYYPKDEPIGFVGYQLGA